MYEEIFILHSNLLKALAHPKRLEIINLLRENELTVSQIKEMLDLPQANISQHLQILRQEKVVKTKRDGKQIYYTLAHPNFLKASDLIRQVLIERNKNNYLESELSQKISDLVPVTKDPVCHMRVSPATASFVCKHKDKDYYFCASGCLKKFELNPKKYENTSNRR